MLAGVGSVPAVVSSVRVAEPRRWHILLERWTQRLADRIVANSQSLMHYMIERGIDAEHITWIPNGIDLRPFAGRKREAHDVTTALFVGRLHPQKGVDVLLDAAGLCREVRFLVVGEGPERATIESVIGERGLDNVRLLGFRHDVPALMARADLLVLPSRWEGMPNVLLEAMAAGCPVVATDVVGSSDLVEDGVNGLLVASEDPQALTDGVRAILNDPARADRLADAGRATAARHDVLSVADGFEVLYASLVGQRAKA
jgi:glycosyltransferase involved in cell wall biosynthesis